ncbi:CotH kinase family protein [Butyrivibrio hungatei]|uniref:CotH kinase family protein n=1 Tax=Butyrivibrio hungatei TaxID=185008 RepID=UPI0004265714|nr:CotH kinase family protein [Butyrivibrio hungatei]
MVTNKHINKIVVIIMAMAVMICVLAGIVMGRSDKYTANANILMEYPSKLFDTNEVISVNIKMDEEEWNEMLENAMSEEYYSCDVEICGTTFKNVAIRPKGNTSLSSVARDPDTDRYSFKLEFGHFMEGQTCFGLDKLILNNNYADATNMKEAIVYDMFNFIGAASPLYNYASISLNGEYKGVYLALEAVEESFLLRNYGTRNGELYKPESMGMGGGSDNKPKSEQGAKSQQGSGGGKPPFGVDGKPDHGDFNPQDKPDMEGDTPGAPPQMPDMEGFDPANMPSSPEGMEGDDSDNHPTPPDGMEGGGPMMGNGGANLNYIDDNLDSYSTIWDGEITDTADNDHRRVVKALKNISEGNDIEKYLDVDNILKYMAVHTFVVNMDSLSGNMAHNYYLYELDGKLNLFPWDYNLSFGGMSSMGRYGEDSDKGTEMVNDAIDTPFSGTDFFDTLLENEEYLEKYHEYLRKLTEEYVDGGRFEETYNRIGSQIDALVKEDPTAFYSYDEYKTACETLYKAVKLRAESINGQLDGTIPSTDEEQKQDSAALIDGSEIDVSAMGTHSGGKKEGNSEFQDNNSVKHSKKKSG